MKHAICVIAYKNFDYIKKFIDQFKNHPDIEFYIHWHNHSRVECEELRNYSPNIRYVCNQFNTTRFSQDLVLAELHLYYVAALNPEICMCHLFSESDYLICSADYFVKYYNDNIESNFVTYIVDDMHVQRSQYSIFNYQYVAHKASQWKSLNMITIQKLLSYLDFADELMGLSRLMRHKLCGALDEFIIPTILKLKCNIDTNLKPNLHYVNWVKCCSHPNDLTYRLYMDPSFNIKDEDVLSNLLVRKIDIMNNDAILFLETMKINFLQKIINEDV